VQSNKPTTHRGDLTKLPRALAPLIDRPQWAVWRWTQQLNGGWQKPPYQARDPQGHASTKDPSTWSDYATALAAVQAGKADGVSFMMTEADPFAAFDLDGCRHPETRSIDIWAQNFLDVARQTYAEVTPSGAGCRIWGLTGNGTEPVNRKFTLEIDGKQIAVELFRRTPKALTVTGYRLDTIRELTSLDRAFDWAMTWAERRKAAAAEVAATQINNHSFNVSGSGHDIDRIEQIVRGGASDGANRSDTFHMIVGHYLGCGWSVERINEHLQQFPAGIAGRYLGEGRLVREIARSAGKYNDRVLPLFDGWKAPEKIVEAPEIPSRETDDPELSPAPATPNPEDHSPELKPAAPEPEIPDPDEDLDEPDDPDDLDEKPDPKLPPLYAHGDKDSRPLKAWLINRLVPRVGHGLLSGQWGAAKTFVVFDLAAALATAAAAASFEASLGAAIGDP
jgi:AAA domain